MAEKKVLLDEAQEIAKDTVTNEELPRLGEIISNLSTIQDSLTDEDINILRKLKEEVLAVTGVASSEREKLAADIRKKIIFSTIKLREGTEKEGVDITLLTLGSRSEQTKKIEALLKFTIAKKLENLSLTSQQIDNVILGVTYKIFNSDILSSLGKSLIGIQSLSTEGIKNLGLRMLGLGGEKVAPKDKEGTKEEDGFLATQIKKVIFGEIEPIFTLLENTKKEKGDLKSLEIFLSNPKEISLYTPQKDISSVKKLTTEELATFTTLLNSKIVGLDRRMGEFEGIKENILGYLEKGGSVLQEAAKGFLEILLKIPFINDIIAGFLGYNSAEEVIPGLFGKELKRRNSISILKTEVKDKKIDYFSGKSIQKIKHSELKGFFEICDKEQIDHTKSGFWKKVFDGIPEPKQGEPALSEEDKKILVLHKQISSNSKETFFDKTTNEPTSKFFESLNSLTLLETQKKEPEMSPEVMARKKSELEGEIAKLETADSNLQGTLTTFLSFTPESLGLIERDIILIKQLSFADLEAENWYGKDSKVRKTIDTHSSGDWSSWLLDDYRTSTKIGKPLGEFRNGLIYFKQNFPEGFKEIFGDLTSENISLALIFEKLPKIREVFGKVKKINGDVLDTARKNLTKITGQMEFQSKRSKIEAELKAATVDTTVLGIAKIKTPSLDIEVSFTTQKIKIGGKEYDISILKSWANSLIGIQKTGESFQFIFGRTVNAYVSSSDSKSFEVEKLADAIMKLETVGVFETGDDRGTLRISKV